MPHKIYLIGIGPEGVTARAAELLACCPCVVASSRHRHLVPEGKEIIAITPVTETLATVAERLTSGNVAVLASGDPLFFGIGRTLLKAVGPAQLEILPALSAIQLAFCRFKEPWDDAHFVSLHGREADHVLPLILPHDKVLVFTDCQNSPAALCRQLVHCFSAVGDEETAASYEVMVGENLGQADERLSRGSLADIAGRDFSNLNVVIFKRTPRPPTVRFGLESRAIRHSRGLITKDEVRAVTLHRLQLPGQGVMWDIGAGSGSVALEAARLNPALSIFAVERRDQEVANINANIRSFGCHTIQVRSGEAPAALASLPDPDRVFIGGSGGSLEAIIELAASRLTEGGIMVVNAVLAATADSAPELMRRQGLAVDACRIQVSRLTETGTEELNPITIIRGRQ